MSNQTPDFDPRPRVLKQGDSFAVFSANGDLSGHSWRECGLFYRDTRHLSRLELRINNMHPVLLASSVRRDNSLFTVDLTNPDFEHAGPRPQSRGFLHLRRSRFLLDGRLFERLCVHNFSDLRAEIILRLDFDADFADIFEVRGLSRAKRGHRLTTEVGGDAVTLAYEGLDRRRRTTTLTFHSSAPHHLTSTTGSFEIDLPSQAATTVVTSVTCTQGDPPSEAVAFGPALRRATRALRKRSAAATHVYTANELFNEWCNQAQADLVMLTSQTPQGPYPFAGTPWFSCPFGRDALITGLLTLWMDPALSRGILAFLAEHQARETDPARDAEPGKILHEMRQGEMAALREVPFSAYFGSVDATPLFVTLAGAYWKRTGDTAFIREIWPHLEAAMAWIEGPGDPDCDGFVEYHRMTGQGLANQGWKDSEDSIFHAGGALAEGPIALVEVQGYVYSALHAAASLAETLNRNDAAKHWTRRAERLHADIHKAFWLEEQDTYAVALDGAKKPCRVATSNAGHLLFSEAVPAAATKRLAATLLSPDHASRWGIRTLAKGQARFNPMSYHNGSIWPHDNAIIGMGLARCGLKRKAEIVLERMFNAAIRLESHRLPELFCGFDGSREEAPVRYAGACVPQAWTSSAPVGLLGALLGLRFDVKGRRLLLDRPVLPAFLDTVQLRKLTIGTDEVDLMIRQSKSTVLVEIERRTGPLEVIVRQ